MMNKLICNLNQIKLASDTSVMEFSGYGAVFGNVDAYGDVIEPGAFAQFMSDAKAGTKSWPAMLSQHGGWGMGSQDLTPIGVWNEIVEDGTGLKVTGQLADTPRGREMYALMKMTPRPAIDGLSIGYVAKESIPRSSPEEPKRRLKRIDLFEISLVTMPANGKARVTGVKSDIEQLMTLADAETFLRDACGFSRSEATHFVSHIKNLGNQRDSGELGELVKLASQIATQTESLKLYTVNQKSR